MNQDGTPVSPQPPIFSGATPSGPSNSNVPGYFNKAMGDIVIDDPNAKKKKNKLPFIIGGAVLLIAAVVLVIVFLAPTVQKNTAKNASKAAYNRFANYMISGEEKEANIPDSYDKTKVYSAEFALSSYTADKDDKGFFAEAAKKYETFYVEAKKSIPEDKISNIETYYGTLHLVSSIIKYGNFTDGQFFLAIAKNGKNQAIQQVKDVYDQYDKKSVSGEYATYMVDAFKIKADFYEILKDNKCVAADGMPTTTDVCLNIIKQNKSNDYYRLQFYEKTAESLSDTAKHNIVKDIWDLRGQVYEN